MPYAQEKLISTQLKLFITCKNLVSLETILQANMPVSYFVW